MFLFVAGVTAVKSATNATFLARRDPEVLPWLYVVTALVTTVVSAGMARALAGRASRALLRNASIVVALSMTALAALAAAEVPGALAALYVSGEVYATTLSVLFWARLGELFDARTAKRRYGPISAAGMAGAMAGGLLVQWGTPLVWCVLGPLALLPALRLLRGGPRFRVEASAPGASGTRELLSRGYARGVAILALGLAMQTVAVDFAFREGATEALRGNEAALAGLFGELNIAVGAVAILVQGALMNLALKRFGVFSFLSVVPVVLGVVGCWRLTGQGGLTLLFLFRAVEMIGSLALHPPALQLLYAPLPSELRGPIRAVVDGSVKKLGGAVGGAALLVLGAREVNAIWVSVLLTGAILLGLQLLRRLHRGELAARIGTPRRPLLLDPSDRATRTALYAALESPDPEKVKAVLTILARASQPGLTHRMAALLQHSDPGVRAQAEALLRRRRRPRWTPTIAAAIEASGGPSEQGPSVELVRAFHVLDPTRAAIWLAPWLEAAAWADPGVVAVAAQTLGQDEQARARAARERLASRVLAAPEETRAQLVTQLGAAAPLAAVLDDPQIEVRRAGLRAAGRGGREDLGPRMVAALADRELREAASDGLVALGDRAVPAAAALLFDRTQPLALRRHVPPVLRRIGTKGAGSALLEAPTVGAPRLRAVIVRALERLRREQPDLPFDRERAEALAEESVEAWSVQRCRLADLEASGRFPLLSRAVSERAEQYLEATFVYLGLVYSGPDAIGVYRGWLRGARLEALELLDSALEGRPLRRRLLAALETPAPVGVSERAWDHLQAIRAGRDRSLALIADETARRLGEASEDTLVPPAGTEREAQMPRSLIDRVFILEEVQLFRGLLVDDLTAVAELCEELSAPPKTVFYNEGDPGDALFVIILGEVHLYRDGTPLMDLFTGDSFGQVSLLDQGPRPVTAIAGEDGVELLKLERQPFMDLVTDRPRVSGGLFEILARRLRELIALRPAPRSASVSSKSRT